MEFPVKNGTFFLILLPTEYTHRILLHINNVVSMIVFEKKKGEEAKGEIGRS